MIVRNQRAFAASLCCVLLVSIGRSALASGSISLSFNWPSRIRLAVERSYEKIDRTPAGRSTSTSRGSYVWTGREDRGEYRVAVSPFVYSEREQLPVQRDPLVLVEHLHRQFQPFSAEIVVDDHGQVERVEGVPAVRKQLIDGYGAVPGLLDHPQARQLIERLNSESAIRERSGEIWSRLVGAWDLVDLEAGVPKTVKAVLGKAAGVPNENIFVYSMIERIPCQPPINGSSCVRLGIQQEPTIGDFRSAVASIVGEELANSLPAGAGSRVEIVNRFTIDTNPKTLVPLAYREEKRWDIFWQDQTGRTLNLGRTEEARYTFQVTAP